MGRLTVGSLFAGIGGMDLGLERAGHEVRWQVEFDKQARGVLRRHWPDVDLHEDVRDVGGLRLDAGGQCGDGAPAHNGDGVRSNPDDRGDEDTGRSGGGDGVGPRSALAPVDLICGGFPCQDLSVAGRRAGLDGDRSGLWFEFHRIVSELRPTWVLVENVPGLLSSNSGADLAVILRGLADLGYLGAWRVLDSQHFGVAQRRRRVFLLACNDPTAGSPAEVLAIAEGLSGHPAPSREAGAGVAASLTRGADSQGKGGYAGRRQEDDYNVVAHTLRAEGFDASEDGTGRGVPLVAQAFHHKASAHQSMNPGDISPSLGTTKEPAVYQCHGSNVGEMGTLREGNGGVTGGVPFVAFDTTQITSAENRNNPQPGDPCHPLAAGAHAPAIAFQPGNLARGEGPRPSMESFPTLKADTGDQSAHVLATIPRRLTPTECERLQGFPDGWTEGQADGPRYRQLGNAVTVNVAEWIGHRLATPTDSEDR